MYNLNVNQAHVTLNVNRQTRKKKVSCVTLVELELST